MDKLTYINDEGNIVFTSKSLRNKKSCCHSTCLHCPYGTTLNKFGVKIEDRAKFSPTVVEKLKDKLKPRSSLGSSLLSEAFGKEKELDDKYLFVLTLKDTICGFCYIQDNKLLKFFLKSEFSDQGITESYLMSLLT